MSNYNLSVAEDRINYTVEKLKEAIIKCDNVDYNQDTILEKTAPYALGWTTSTMKNALFDLEKALEMIQGDAI